MWPIYIAICAMIALQVVISDKLAVGPKYSLAILEALLLVGTVTISPNAEGATQHIRRGLSLILIMLVTIANIASLGLVVIYLVNGLNIDGHTLILSALGIYFTNILIFSIWYWEVDSPGLTGYIEPERGPDFIFPQMSSPDVYPAYKNWQPRYFDYLYISITNATAFSPTDAMPATDRIKILMALQSFTSFITVALVAARAVNILS
jgi:uncharacterized membrane protein